MDGGAGSDTAKYLATVVADLAAGTANDGCGIDTLISIENLIGSASADTLSGNAVNNLLDGLGGNDLLKGRDGADNLKGGNGSDTLNGGNGVDVLDCGSGVDTADYSENSGAVTVFLSTGESSDNDTLISCGNMKDTPLNDTLGGDGGNNTLTGGSGNDDLFGGSGTEVCDGGPGDDVCRFCETMTNCENERPDRCEIIGCPPIP